MTLAEMRKKMQEKYNQVMSQKSQSLEDLKKTKEWKDYVKLVNAYYRLLLNPRQFILGKFHKG